MKEPTPEEKIVRVTLRLPEVVHDALVALAGVDRRSLNNEVVYLLEQIVKERQAPKPPPAAATPGETA